MHLRSAALMLLFCGGVTTAVMAEEPKRISVDGYEIAYVEAGQGEPVIFVHGGSQDYQMWSEQLPKFGARYRAIAYSRRNNYPNERSPEGTPNGAADVHGEDLAGLVRALGYSKARIVAHSSGAHAALFFAATHPDMVVSLALNEPPATGMLNGVPDGREILKEFGGRLAAGREALKAGDVQRGIPLFVNGVGGPGNYERRSDADKKMNLENVASHHADATTKRPRAVFTCEMAKKIRAPTLLSNGERSPAHCRSVGSVFAQPRKDRDCGSSHTVSSENPDAYDQAVLSFMEKH